MLSKQSPLMTDEDLVRAFTKLFEDGALEEIEEDVDAALREAGYDPGEVGARMKAAAEEALAQVNCCDEG